MAWIGSPKLGYSCGAAPRRPQRTIGGVEGVVGRHRSTAQYCPRLRVPWLGSPCPGLFIATHLPRTGAASATGSVRSVRGPIAVSRENSPIPRSTGGSCAMPIGPGTVGKKYLTTISTSSRYAPSSRTRHSGRAADSRRLTVRLRVRRTRLDGPPDIPSLLASHSSAAGWHFDTPIRPVSLPTPHGGWPDHGVVAGYRVWSRAYLHPGPNCTKPDIPAAWPTRTRRG